jgi:hypothetical protein
VKVLVASRASVGVDIVSETRTSGVDCGAHHRLDSLDESHDRGVAQAIESLVRVKPSAEEPFVGVDVADAGEERLVEEGRLGLATKAAEATDQD